MKLKKYLPIILLALGVLLLIGAVLVFVFGAGNSEGLRKAILIIVGIFMIFDGGLLLYLSTLLGKENPNFFLYDSATDKNIDVRDLTFAQVNRRMSMYMRQISTSGHQMWNENIIGSDNELLGENGLFKPLVAYKMLYDLTAVGNDDIWLLFTQSDKQVVKSMAEALTMNGDSEMGGTLMYLRDNSDDGSDISKIKTFVNDNAKYIQGRMVKYVRENIDLFI